MKPIEPGQVWRRVVPFKLETDRAWESEDAEWNWVPGKRCVASGPDSAEWVSDGTGEERRQVVAVVSLPKPYPPRVFYLRAWTDPDGKDFGNNKLRCCALGAFTRWRNFGAQLGDPQQQETKA